MRTSIAVMDKGGMRRNGRWMLLFAAILMACVSVFHLVCGVVGPAAYRYLGGGEAMANAAESAPWLTVLTLGLAAVFGLFTLYALSAAGRVRRLPLTRVAIVVVGVVFALRGLSLVPELIALLRGSAAIPFRNLFYSFVALLIGLLYLLGLIFSAGRSPEKAAP